MIMAVGFVIQMSALLLIYARHGRAWHQYLGSYFVGLAVVYHGLGEALILLFPGYNPYRRYLKPADVEGFFVLVSVGILLLTIVYVVLAPQYRLAAWNAAPRWAADVQRVLDWRVVVALTLPLAVWTVRGHGLLASAGYQDPGQPSSFTSELSAQYLLLFFALSSVSVVLRFGRRFALPMLAIQSITLASVGQRNAVVVGAILFVYGMSRIGIKWSGRTLMLLSALLVGVALTMTAARANFGRDPFAAGQGASDRMETLVEAVNMAGNEQTRLSALSTLGYRLDGNSFGAMEYAAIRKGHDPLGATPILNDVRLAIPSALYPGKLDADALDRSSKLYAQVHFGLPRRDILATQLGATVGYLGAPSLILAAVIFGAFLAALDRWLMAPVSPARLVVGIGAVSAIAHYGRSFESWTVTGRGVLVLASVLFLAGMFRKMVGHGAKVPIGATTMYPHGRRSSPS